MPGPMQGVHAGGTVVEELSRHAAIGRNPINDRVVPAPLKRGHTEHAHRACPVGLLTITHSPSSYALCKASDALYQPFASRAIISSANFHHSARPSLLKACRQCRAKHLSIQPRRPLSG